MNRKTIYDRNYGYVTTYEGQGILDTIVKGITGIVISDRTKDIVTAGAKAASSAIGDKGGKALVDKITSKVSLL